MDLLHQIEEERNSKVVVYITGDRQRLETKIGIDTFPFIANHLRRIGTTPKIDLFLYSTGGITIAGYSLVNMIKEYTDSFGVLIPFKAWSSATLVALGANDIVMSRMGQLSPIDPSVQHPLGPSLQVPGQPGLRQPIPANVEDIFNYFDLARTELKITDSDSLERLLENLSEKVHPLVLGHGYRLREQIEFLSRTLLSAHMDDQDKITQIVENLIRGRYSHSYIFGRREASDILGLPIHEDNKTEELILDLFSEYQEMLELSNPHSLEIAIGDGDEMTRSYDRAIIESIDLTHVFRSNRFYRRLNVPIPNTQITTPQVIEGIINEGWVEDNTI